MLASVFLLTVATTTVWAQVDTHFAINTYAGGGGYVDSPPRSVTLSPWGVIVGPDGALYVTDRQTAYTGSSVYRVDPVTGTVTRIVGNGIAGYSGDGGPPTAASLKQPESLAFDDKGNLFIADTGNGAIREVSADPAFDPSSPQALPGGPISSKSVITTYSLDYPYPSAVAFDPTYTHLYVAVGPNLGGVWERVTAISVDGSGSPPRVVVGCPNGGGCVAVADGAAALSVYINPIGMTFDSTGNLYVENGGSSIFRVNASDATVTLVTRDPASPAGATEGCAKDALATNTLLNAVGFASDNRGDLLLYDISSQRICRIDVDPATGAIDSGSMIVSVGGGGLSTAPLVYGGPSWGDGGPAGAARFGYARGITVDPAGNILFADSDFGVVRRIGVDPQTGIADPASIISTVVGTGSDPRFGGDGNPATSATLASGQEVGAPGEPGLFWGLAADSRGDLYIADQIHIRRVDGTSKIISTVAGDTDFASPPPGCPTIAPADSGDGASALCIGVYNVTGVATDANGNFYFADNSRVRRVDPSGIISTVAGTGVQGFSGDGGPATLAMLNQPEGITVDRTGNVYIADAGNNRIRKVDTLGIITTIAGNGAPATGSRLCETGCSADGGPAICEGGCPGDGGPAVVAPLNRPLSLAVDPAGNVYFTDSGEIAVRRIDAATGVIATLKWGYGKAGTGSFCGDFIGDRWTCLQAPSGIAIDASGNLFVSNDDQYWNSIVELLAPSPTPGEPGVWQTAYLLRTDLSTNALGEFSGDGGVGQVELSHPMGLSVDSKGNLYVWDGGSHRVRVITGVAIGRGDVNDDFQVDKNDLALVTSVLNTPASGPNDPRDLNHDGVINALDARILVTLCTYAGCATN